MTEIIRRDPPFEGLARDCDSMGIVWFTDGLHRGASTFRPVDDDPEEWIANIETYWDEKPKPQKTPYHFYVAQDGDIFEGLGWKARSRWHELGKNEDFPHDGGNSIAVMFLGASEEFTNEAQTSCRWLVLEAQEMFSRGQRNVLYSQVNTNSKAGGAKGSRFHDWATGGCGPVDESAADAEVVVPLDELTNAKLTEMLEELTGRPVVGKPNKTTLIEMIESISEDSEPMGSESEDPTLASAS
jgi:hypothetical protein